ncbi:Membrane-bound lytic murein transglycosylase B [Candidatus Methylobacter favarea]|uniref:Membrane-bound lytic murein transglycosylase B n=1 Tax=Candidatus Methylobacter favarea TaxID=2707345 RepID=A0A8S0X784_9GAMM|nr:lytic murein transglycosylase B [Candidatus Methylobacter favarea]CAA9889855.1 Membrane-bound lytic murein transglycosylase B [Candidatus Methylobacter favarea]
MKLKYILAQIILGGVCLTAISCAPEIKRTKPVDIFISQMAAKHRFSKSELDKLFKSVEIKDDIIKRISSPAESLPWYKYRRIFLTESRIHEGVKFWQENAPSLAAVEQKYGVPAEIIVAILGVETRYGQKTGSHRVIDALSTLAFAYPPRSKFFLGELENYLLLCREENLNPLQPTGSYAGAMGLPQFMPSSFRTYAADFDNDRRRDIWHNNSDVIASIANYLASHQWQRGQAVAIPVKAVGESYKAALKNNLKPNLTIPQLQSLQILLSKPLPLNTKVTLLAFKQEQGEELWAALENFYVITRYNHSPLYALAVYQLSQAISIRRWSSPYE